MKLIFIIILQLMLQSCMHLGESNTKINHKKAAQYNSELGMVYLKQGNKTLSKEKLLKALAQDPTSAIVNSTMAFFLEETGETEKAKNYYLRAINIAKNKGPFFNNYGTFLCRQKQYDEALKYFQKAVEDLHYKYTANAYENAGLCELENQNTIKAKQYFLLALLHDSNKLQSLFELVLLEMQEKNYANALKYLKQYPIQNASLLALAKDVAHKAGDKKIQEQYTMELNKFNNNSYGVEYEYNPDIG